MDDEFRDNHCGACKLDLTGVEDAESCPRCGIDWPTPPDMENEFADGDICG